MTTTSSAALRARYRGAHARLMGRAPAAPAAPCELAVAAAAAPEPVSGPTSWLAELMAFNEELRRLFLPPRMRREPGPGEGIRDVVAAHYGITGAEMVGRSNARRIAWPRQVAMYICAHHAGLAPALVVRLFGDRDRATVVSAVRAVTARTRKHGALAAEVSALIATCGLGGAA